MKSSSINSELEVVLPGGQGGHRDNEPEHGGRNQLIARLWLLWQHRQFLFRAVAWGLVAATIVAFLIPKQYESTTQLMPPDEQSSAGVAMLATLTGKMSGGLGSVAGDLLGGKSSGALFIGILGSRTVQDSLINKFDLRKIYWKKSWQDARQELAVHTSISEDRKSGIITVKVSDRDPKRSAALAQEYVTQLNAVVSQLSSSSARRERIFLEGRLEEVKQGLTEAEKDFSEYASKTGAIDIKEQGKAMVSAAAILQGELIAAESELEGLKQIYTENNVRVRSLQARVTELRLQLERVGGKDDADKGATSEKDDSLYPSIRKLPLLGVSYADLYRRTKVQEVVFETLTQEYELAKVAEAKEIPTVKVLDPANVPEKKSFPPRLLMMCLGSLLCLAVAIAGVLIRGRWEEVDPREPRKIFIQEVVGDLNGHMPWATPNGSRFQAVTHSVWLRMFGQMDSQKANESEPHGK